MEGYAHSGRSNEAAVNRETLKIDHCSLLSATFGPPYCSILGGGSDWDIVSH